MADDQEVLRGWTNRGCEHAPEPLHGRERQRLHMGAGQREQILRPFDELSASIGSVKLIAVIRDALRRFEENDYRRQLSQMAAWAQPAPASASGENPTPTPAPEPRIEYVPGRAVKVSFGKAWLADETDVDWYLEAMREALLEEIRKGKRIQV